MLLQLHISSSKADALSFLCRDPDDFEFTVFRGVDRLYLLARFLFASGLKEKTGVEGSYCAVLEQLFFFCEGETPVATDHPPVIGKKTLADAQFLLVQDAAYKDYEEFVFNGKRVPLSLEILDVIVRKMISISRVFLMDTVANELDSILFKLKGEQLQLLFGRPVIVNKQNWSKKRSDCYRQQIVTRLARVFAHAAPAYTGSRLQRVQSL